MATDGDKINPEGISRTAKVPWVNHFLPRTLKNSRASIEVTEANGNLLLKNSGVIMLAFFDKATLLLLCCYCSD